MTRSQAVKPRPEPVRLNDKIKETGGIVAIFPDLQYCLNAMQQWINEMKAEGENLTIEQQNKLSRVVGNIIHVRTLLCGNGSGVTGRKYGEKVGTS